MCSVGLTGTRQNKFFDITVNIPPPLTLPLHLAFPTLEQQAVKGCQVGNGTAFPKARVDTGSEDSCRFFRVQWLVVYQLLSCRCLMARCMNNKIEYLGWFLNTSSKPSSTKVNVVAGLSDKLVIDRTQAHMQIICLSWIDSNTWPPQNASSGCVADTCSFGVDIRVPQLNVGKDDAHGDFWKIRVRPL